MPSLSGIESKIRAVIECGQADMATSTGERVTILYEALVPMREIVNNRYKFVSDIETREQAEKRIVRECISSLNHTGCTSCMALATV